ncbi:chemotaxis protein CheA [Undibacterium squillarum]|uniref:Chemotaxis protein CheA n=1 Tax=Undibacterium squillarum TaxID=1131567 RepID=A0ABQ2XZV7_9BURK|nr:chemotaxis protein CheA [Undibacterium squillarum]GGX47143.1 chemotaxis protein CheA [Undibacterium squillarum]
MSFDSEMQAALETFVAESRDLLQDMEELLLNLEHSDSPADAVNAIFRAAHTIKGSAGLFGIDHIVKFTHTLESLLDQMRDGEIQVSSGLIAVLLPCRDHLMALIDGIAAGRLQDPPELAEHGAELQHALQQFMDGKAGANAHVAEHQPDIQPIAGAQAAVDSGNWYLSLRFGPDCLRNGMDPLSFIRYLSTVGDVVHLSTIITAVPELPQMDAETCYLGFEIVLKSAATKEAIESVFEFVRDDSTIRIIAPNSRVDEYIEIIKGLSEDHEMLGEILVKSGVLTRHELESCLQKQSRQREQSHGGQKNPHIGEILVREELIQAPLVDAALHKQQQVKEQKARERQSIRVDAERLDKLIDLVGELVIAGAGANLRASKLHDESMTEATSEVMRLVEEVRDSALQLRMVPIGTTFSRFQRVVRDVSLELGKDIVLDITGGETEVDKSVVEKIGDPLMHLVRNSMDHGIEPVAVREARGKPAQGTLKLHAYHESGSIVIEVSDDGGGLNKDKILARAIERGLIERDTVLSEKEIFELIFEPGFSTAEQVSSLSGRGVGMDVVKKNVQSLRGVIEIDSEMGVGTTMRLRLPLTLAIIDGFLVEVGESAFVVPLDHVIECLELPQDGLQQDYMDLRGEVLPYIRLRQLFDIQMPLPRRQNVVVVGYGGEKAGLVVDRLMGEFQTVIKPLGRLFQHVQGIGGSTILGSGQVALILSVAAMLQHSKKQEQQFLQSSPAALPLIREN